MDERENHDEQQERNLASVRAYITGVQDGRTDIDMTTLQAASGLEVVQCGSSHHTTMGNFVFVVTDGDSTEIEVITGDLVMLLATAILSRNGQSYDIIKIVLDSKGRMGWLWHHESDPV